MPDRAQRTRVRAAEWVVKGLSRTGLSVVLLLLLCVSLAMAYPPFRRAYVTGDEVRLRTAASPDAPVAGLMRRGQQMGVVSRKAGWAEVVPLEFFVPAEAVGREDGRVAASGADLRLDMNGPAVGRIAPGAMLQSVNHGDPWALVEMPPPGLRYWVADQFLDQDGIALRPGDFVRGERLVLSRADFDRLAALKGLRLVILPTGDVGTPELQSADSGRFGPSYSVRYSRGSHWFEVSAGTSGFGGPGLDEPLYQVQSPLLGKVLITRMNHGGSKDLMSSSSPILDGSTLEGKPCSLSLFFTCNPEADPAWVRRILESFKAARLP